MARLPAAGTEALGIDKLCAHIMEKLFGALYGPFILTRSLGLSTRKHAQSYASNPVAQLPLRT